MSSAVEQIARELVQLADEARSVRDIDLDRLQDIVDRARAATADRPDLAPYVAAARDIYHDEGELEFDEGAIVSCENPEAGAYVECWKWIEAEEAARYGLVLNEQTVDNSISMGPARS